MLCKTQTQLADALGVTKGTLSKYLRRDDWPVRRSRPWGDADVEAARKWRLGLQDDRSEKAKPAAPGTSKIAEQKARAQAVKETHNARKAKVEADRAEQLVMPTDTFELAVAAMARLFRRQLDELVASIPHRLDGDVLKNTDVLKAWRREVCERLSAQQELEIEAAKEGT